MLDDAGNVITIAVFVATQAIMLVGTITTLKGDGRVIKNQIENMQTELTHVRKVLSELADIRGDMRLIQERGLLQGQRVDEMQKRFNQWMDRDPKGA